LKERDLVNSQSNLVSSGRFYMVEYTAYEKLQEKYKQIVRNGASLADRTIVLEKIEEKKRMVKDFKKKLRRSKQELDDVLYYLNQIEFSRNKKEWWNDLNKSVIKKWDMIVPWTSIGILENFIKEKPYPKKKMK